MGETPARSVAPGRRRRRALVWLGATAGVGLLVVLGGAWLVAGELMRPVRKVIDALPSDLPVVEVELPSDSGARLRGWFLPAPGEQPAARAVALFHGLRGDRRAMLPRMRFLHAAGFATLAVDLQAHGESDGDQMTFGVRESRDAHGAVRFLRARLPGVRVAAIGVSLGGAACLLGAAPVAVDALILETVYPTVEQAARNRIARNLGAWPGALLAPLLVWQCGPRLGITADQLRPITAIPRIQAPVLLIGGGADEHTTPAETRALFAAAPEPKGLWLVEGAIHLDMHIFARAEYERRVLRFLETSLR